MVWYILEMRKPLREQEILPQRVCPAGKVAIFPAEDQWNEFSGSLSWRLWRHDKKKRLWMMLVFFTLVGGSTDSMKQFQNNTILSVFDERSHTDDIFLPARLLRCVRPVNELVHKRDAFLHHFWRAENVLAGETNTNRLPNTVSLQWQMMLGRDFGRLL